jgi:hypothetical protein
MSGDSKKYFTDLSKVYDLEGWFWRYPGRTPFPPSVTLIKRDLFAKTGIWDTLLKSPAEDFDIFRRMSSFTSFAGIEDTLVVRKAHEKSLTKRKSSLYFEDNLRAVKRMFSEDKKINTLLNRCKSWTYLHLNFFKHSLKFRDTDLFFITLSSFVKFWKFL